MCLLFPILPSTLSGMDLDPTLRCLPHHHLLLQILWLDHYKQLKGLVSFWQLPLHQSINLEKKEDNWRNQIPRMDGYPSNDLLYDYTFSWLEGMTDITFLYDSSTTQNKPYNLFFFLSGFPVIIILSSLACGEIVVTWLHRQNQTPIIIVTVR